MNKDEYNALVGYKAKKSGSNRPSGPRGKRMRKMDYGEFIAWDGEGQNTGMLDEKTTKSVMNLFANSTGDYIVSSDRTKPLSTVECLEFILKTGLEHPNAIHTIYFGNWDITHILRDVPPKHLIRLIGKKSNSQLNKTAFWQGYGLYYVPSKEFRVTKYKYERDRRGKLIRDEKGKYKRKSIASVTIWDVSGFFQSSFVKAIEDWYPKEKRPPEYELIKQGKTLRDKFSDESMEFLIRYNAGELRVLVELMHKLLAALNALDLRLQRWDGAGAIAVAMMRKHNIKEHIPKQEDLPPALLEAAKYAYFGGWVERMQIGIYRGVAYQNDTNSAYPYAMLHMPSLTHGSWQHIENPDLDTLPEFSLVRVAWDLAPKSREDTRRRICPFPYRDDSGGIYFPYMGHNWVWMPQIAAFQESRLISDVVEAYEAWIFVPDDSAFHPFEEMILSYYQLRQDITNGLRPDLASGAEKPIKLGMNSLYGKLAQHAGYNPETGRIPRYHCLLYAGFVTAFTRANLYRAAMQNPDAIIGIATDGIFSTEPLNLPVSKTKELGKWESKKLNGMISIQSGIYISNANEEPKVYTRGIDRLETPEQIEAFVEAIEETLKQVDYSRRVAQQATLKHSLSRYVGIRGATRNEEWFQRLGCWYTIDKEIDFTYPAGGKRNWDKKSNPRPYEGMTRSYPNYLKGDITFSYIKQTKGLAKIPLSTIYKLPWDFREDYYDELEYVHDIHMGG